MKGKCRICGKKGNLTKHHITRKSKYKRMAHTEKFLFGVPKTETLCRKCHDELHGMGNK